MKLIAVLGLMLFASNANASLPAQIALERLSYELSAADSIEQKEEAASFYFSTLERLDSRPKGQRSCLLSVASGRIGQGCKPVQGAVQGGGTGGAD